MDWRSGAGPKEMIVIDREGPGSLLREEESDWRGPTDTQVCVMAEGPKPSRRKCSGLSCQGQLEPVGTRTRCGAPWELVSALFLPLLMSMGSLGASSSNSHLPSPRGVICGGKERRKRRENLDIIGTSRLGPQILASHVI